MNKQLLATLQAVDTPTVINAIEVAQGSRDFGGFTRLPVHAAGTCCQAFVGRALTARIRASAPPEEEAEVINARRNRYYRYLAREAEEEPSIIAIEDLDHPNCTGAWWGEINAAIHKALGLAGAITNGLVRDLDFLAPGFPILAGAVGVSHAHVHVVDFGQPIRVFGLKIAPGDLIHADKHGAAVIPDE
ncbi:MAG: RraA family protein [Boseongicola sp.]|nr:RraA family protein [Boseongicola sp.]